LNFFSLAQKVDEPIEVEPNLNTICPSGFYESHNPEAEVAKLNL